MHVFDAHDQHLGQVVLVRRDHFVLRQDLGIRQLVAVPMVAVAGVVSHLVLLNLTPGEIELFCRPLLRREDQPAGAPTARLLHQSA
jgi:hypothetical protein